MANRRNKQKQMRAAPTRPRKRLAMPNCCRTMALSRRSVGKQGRHLPRSGPGLRDESAKSPLALPIFANGGFDCRPVEIWPVGRNKDQLAVCCLPQQEIG